MTLRLLIIKDKRPGHFRKAEGIAKAIGRRVKVQAEEITIVRPSILPNRLLRALSRFPTGDLLARAYGVNGIAIHTPDIIISAGADTLPLNLCLTRRFKCSNIFSGSIRGLPPEYFSAIIHTDPAAFTRPRHIVVLLPSVIDPDVLAPPRAFGDGLGDRSVALLVGGPSGSCRYVPADWEALDRLIVESAGRGLHWRISSSRRTLESVTEMLGARATALPGKLSFLDYRREKPGSADDLFNADAVLVTADSSTMLGEAVAARRPVVVAEPHSAVEYHPGAKAIIDAGHAVPMPLAGSSPERLLAAILTARPIDYNPLERIGGRLAALGLLEPSTWPR